MKISVIDSHTAGEPTRVVTGGFPELAGETLAAKRDAFTREFDHLRRAVVNEPRGSDVLVGALLLPPTDPACAAGVIFFNNVGTLGMCGHGLIGLVVTLAHLGRIGVGTHKIETPVGVVEATYEGANTVSVRNVPARRSAATVTLEVENYGPVTGDIAWGGNWFFLVREHGFTLDLQNVDALTAFTWQIRRELARQDIAGDDDAEIDHIELFGPPTTPGADSKNFVLCPGKAYDRSPCGTGTSAKIACLIASGQLAPGDWYTQESIIGSTFQAKGDLIDGHIIPTIRGQAFVNAEATLVFDDNDPFRFGIA